MYYKKADGEIEETNWELKDLLHFTVENSDKDWSTMMFDTLWAYKTGLRTPVGVSPFRYVYGYNCHLSGEMKQLCSWTIDVINSDYEGFNEHPLLTFQESEE